MKICFCVWLVHDVDIHSLLKIASKMSSDELFYTKLAIKLNLLAVRQHEGV